MWFAVAGSDRGPARARRTYHDVVNRGQALLQRKVDSRCRVDQHSAVSLPGDRLLQRSVTWSKQNLADSVQEARRLRLRWVNAGKAIHPLEGRLGRARWLGAGWPDYPWIFGTDGEYTAFASVAMGQFDPIKAHLRTLRAVSDIINERSGKVVHEVTPDGAVYFGANQDPGNTDETAKFPSAVALIWRWTGDDSFRDGMYGFARRNMRYIVNRLDDDNDGWPEGLGNVEREGMGEEKLDNTVYTIRGLRDLADMARSKGDPATASWASSGPAFWSAASSRRGGMAETTLASTPTPSRTRATRRCSSATGSVSPRWTRAVPRLGRAHPSITTARGDGVAATSAGVLHGPVWAVPHRYRRV